MSRRSPVPEWVPADLPTAPGVYRFLGERGEPLYIGKSVNLRRRVRGYFYGGGPEGRLADLRLLARRLTYRRTGSDLEARLLEARAILAHRPRFNRAIKNRWRTWFLEIDESIPFPRPRVVRRVRHPSARYFGPFASRHAPVEIARLVEDLFGLRSCPGPIRPDANGSACLRHQIGRCAAPCIGAESLNRYRQRVRDAIRVLDDPRQARWLRSRLLRQSTKPALSASTRSPDPRRRLAWLDELEAFRTALTSPSRQPSLLAILPHHRPELRVFLPVALGKALPMRVAGWQFGAVDRAVADACYAIRVSELGMNSARTPHELVASFIVRRWLEQGAPEGQVFDLARVTDEEILRSTRAALDPGVSTRRVECAS